MANQFFIGPIARSGDASVVTLTDSSSEILAENTSRSHPSYFQNIGEVNAYIELGGVDATVADSFVLFPGSSFLLSGESWVITDQVKGIVASGTCKIKVYKT